MMINQKTIVSCLKHDATRFAIKASQAALVAFLLSSCGGGAATESLPPGSGAPIQSGYSGPPPASADVQAFRVNLWENVRVDSRCGQCHTAGGQAPMFARSDDVNSAYTAAQALVNRETPSMSRFVEKVSTGHGCWESVTSACVDTMTRWIESWVGGGEGGGRQILLTAPVIKDPGQSKNFPDSPAGFTQVHNLLETHCSECHASSAEFAQSPYFGSEDIDEAYQAAKSKINLDLPGESRLVLRLRNEFHNCWLNPTCEADADAMEAAISNFAGNIQPDVIDGDFVISKALLLEDGIVASGGDRFEDNLVALWEFKEPPGSRVANDTSGKDPAIDLTLSGDADFINGWGIRINSGKAQGLTSTSKKLYDKISLTGEYSIEAWVAPANVTQDEAFIVSYSGSNDVRNFTLGQTLYNYDFFNRSSNTGTSAEQQLNGAPALSTADADEDLQATLQHVVVNFDPVNGRSIYVNGVYTDDVDTNPGGSIGSWRNNFAFVLGNETSGDRQWQGTIRMVAIHERTLSPEQIQQNFDVGVGQKFFLLFYLGDVITDIPDPYLMFEVSQFDNFSYLFNQPRFISLDTSVTPGAVPIAGITIGINGKISPVGQTFRAVDTTAPGFPWAYTPDGAFLSDRGTIIAQQKGASQDEFFICFATLGTQSNICLDPIAPSVPGNPDPVPVDTEFGLRTFEEVNASMSVLTTISMQETFVKSTYQRVKQQLPTSENMGGFQAAHQMAVAQLAIEYCNALVDNTSKRSAFWPDFNFNDSVNAAFGASGERDDAVLPLIERVTLPDMTPEGDGSALSTQPSISDLENELNDLIDELINCRQGQPPYAENVPRGIQYCSANRTEIVMKAVCGAAIGNAAILVQ